VFYYNAVLNSFSHQQLFQFKIYRHMQAESFTNFCYLIYVVCIKSMSTDFLFNYLLDLPEIKVISFEV